MKRPDFLIHMGQHKTGSKALQFFCAKHARSLRKLGVLYEVDGGFSQGIRAYAVSHYRLFAHLRREAMEDGGEHDAAARFWRDVGNFCEPWKSSREMLGYLERQRVKTGAGTVLVSAEDLFDMHTAHELDFHPERIQHAARRLVEGIAEIKVSARLVVYLRRSDHLLGAHYAQFIKGSPCNDLDFPVFAKAFAPRLRAGAILDMWAAVFGRENVTVRAYEPRGHPGGIVADFFENVLGFSQPLDWEPPESTTETVNITPDRPHIEFLRILNRRNCGALPGLPREAVLESALSSPPGRGIAEWMTPRERLDLLNAHRSDHEAIARTYLHRPNGRLFSEEIPDKNVMGEALNPLTSERSVEIAVRVHQILSAKAAVEPQTKARRPFASGLVLGIGAFLMGFLLLRRSFSVLR